MTRTYQRIGLVILTATFAACSGAPSSAPTAPTATQVAPVPVPASQPTVGVNQWNLTTTLSRATGLAGCVVDISHMHVGDSYRSWVLEIERSGTSVHLVYFDFYNPRDRYEYDGTIDGDTL